MVEIDSNAILVESMKSCKNAEMIGAYDTLLQRLKWAGIAPKKHVLDNKVSKNTKNHISDTHKFDMELVPPECHQQNAAEVAICNFKAHFLSVLTGVFDDFPPSLWDRLLPQVHEKMDKQGTWAFHLVDRWHLFTSPEHYRTHNCHVKHTKSKCLSNTVQFQHKHIPNPSITHANKVMHALADCVKAIQGMTGKDRHSPAKKDLQQIVDATQAQIKAQPNQFEHMATDIPPVQRGPRVQTTTSMLIPHTDANRRITHSMNMTTPFPRVPIDSAPTNKPNAPLTDSMRWKRVRKRHAAQLQSADPTINASPRTRTQTKVATVAAQVAPLALSTRLHTQQYNLPPLSRCPGTKTTSMRYGSTHTMHHTTGEQGSPSIGSHGCRYRQAPQLQAINEKHEIQKGMEPFIGQQIWMISKWHWWQNKEPHQHHRVHLPTQGTERAKVRCYVWAICVHSTTQKG